MLIKSFRIETSPIKKEQCKTIHADRKFRSIRAEQLSRWQLHSSVNARIFSYMLFYQTMGRLFLQKFFANHKEIVSQKSISVPKATKYKTNKYIQSQVDLLGIEFPDSFAGKRMGFTFNLLVKVLTFKFLIFCFYNFFWRFIKRFKI